MKLVAAALIMLLASPALAEIAGQASVIDGDTIDIHGQENTPLHEAGR